MAGSPNACSSKPAQEGFRRVSSTGEPSSCPIPGLGPGVLEMRVKEGSKIRNLVGFAMSRLQGEGPMAPVSQVMFTGIGRAITKTITCAEIMKRNVQGLHQVSKLQYRTVREVWQSQEDEGVQMTVLKNVPAIYIFLSKEPLDPLELGYQSPAETSSSSEENTCGDATESSRKRPLIPESVSAGAGGGVCLNAGGENTHLSQDSGPWLPPPPPPPFRRY
ncbi:ribonuclease P protein subunit p25a [Salminus brasiliensis]|uniref:ribonuclease P protein subunit p25a n=1 Tax=Salminus brasiliensis TaxID=930266 RepID=UPI003B82CF94